MELFLRRFLLSPDGGDGGGGGSAGSGTAGAAPATGGQAAAGQSGAGGESKSGGEAKKPEPTQESRVSLTEAEYKQLMARVNEQSNQLRTIEETKRAEQEAAESKRIKAVAEKEGVEAALNQLRTQHQQTVATKDQEIGTWRQRYLDREVALTVVEAMQGRQWLNPKAAAAAQKLLSDGLTADWENERAIVRHAESRRPAADVLKELLDSDDFAFFQAAKGKGGPDLSGAARSDGGNQASDQTYGQRKIAEWKQQQAEDAKSTATRPSMIRHFANQSGNRNGS